MMLLKGSAVILDKIIKKKPFCYYIAEHHIHRNNQAFAGPQMK